MPSTAAGVRFGLTAPMGLQSAVGAVCQCSWKPGSVLNTLCAHMRLTQELLLPAFPS